MTVDWMEMAMNILSSLRLCLALLYPTIEVCVCMCTTAEQIPVDVFQVLVHSTMFIDKARPHHKLFFLNEKKNEITYWSL